ncbi:flavodoxin [Schleiferilactobacillus perolens]|uniref:Flavodoxin-like domain-containing protein n=1 Tax=Schleiferilactobacillus perolens DSM 12744 TaxID=1423792 RepID=A0A0R1MYX0_9LACO|nr:flavodoxin [Schleiferilactobacillus perolens]KRL13335.1 hypothetical protein FD09_GL002163 [Schleiferilactobacillus perolens DSM 12744]
MANRALIAYFSLSGATEKMADILQKVTHGTLYPIQVVEPFPDDMYKTNDVAEAQRQSHQYPDLAGELPSLKDVNIVLLGGPVWNGHPSTPLLRLVEEMDFGTVPIAPFYSYATDPSNYAKEIDGLLGNHSLASLGMPDKVVDKTNKATAELQKWWDTVRQK